MRRNSQAQAAPRPTATDPIRHLPAADLDAACEAWLSVMLASNEKAEADAPPQKRTKVVVEPPD